MERAQLLSEIEAFLKETGMGPSYFSKCAANNGELVKRLRTGGDCETATVSKVREFIRNHRAKRTPAEPEAAQPSPGN